MGQIDYDAMAVPFARHRGASGLVLAEMQRGTSLSEHSRVLEVGWSGYVALGGKVP